jgi:hypothetical protein
MSSRLRNLGVTAVVGILLASLGSSLLAPDEDGSAAVAEPPSPATSPQLQASPEVGASSAGSDSSPATVLDSADPASIDPENDRREYAVALSELNGLPVDAPPGARMDVWVTWHPPVTNKPTVQRLIQGAVLERIIPPLTSDGPEAVLLSVAKSRLSALIFGDRFGELSVAMLPPMSATP